MMVAVFVDGFDAYGADPDGPEPAWTKPCVRPGPFGVSGPPPDQPPNTIRVQGPAGVGFTLPLREGVTTFLVSKAADGTLLIDHAHEEPK